MRWDRKAPLTFSVPGIHSTSFLSPVGSGKGQVQCISTRKGFTSAPGDPLPLSNSRAWPCLPARLFLIHPTHLSFLPPPRLAQLSAPKCFSDACQWMNKSCHLRIRERDQLRQSSHYLLIVKSLNWLGYKHDMLTFPCHNCQQLCPLLPTPFRAEWRALRTTAQADSESVRSVWY